MLLIGPIWTLKNTQILYVLYIHSCIRMNNNNPCINFEFSKKVINHFNLKFQNHYHFNTFKTWFLISLTFLVFIKCRLIPIFILNILLSIIKPCHFNNIFVYYPFMIVWVTSSQNVYYIVFTGPVLPTDIWS